MKQPYMWIVLAVVVIGFMAWRAMSAKRASAEAHSAVEGGALLLDVRTVAEFEDGHVKGATNIPVQNLPKRIADVGDKKRAVVVYCRSGARSSRARRILLEAGYEQVIDLGPMSAW